jgi:putative redox protein
MLTEAALKVVTPDHLGFRTTCGRQVRIGRLPLGAPDRPVWRISLDVGHAPDGDHGTWAGLTPAEARRLAVALLAQAAAIDRSAANAAIGRSAPDGAADRSAPIGRSAPDGAADRSAAIGRSAPNGAAERSGAGDHSIASGTGGDSGEGRIDVAHVSGESYAITTRGHAVLADQPVRSGGADAAPTPTELLVAALASCVAFYSGRYLVRHGLDRDGLAVSAEFTMATDRPARVGGVRLRITVPGPLPESRRAALLAVASHCTVHNTLRQEPEVAIDLA